MWIKSKFKYIIKLGEFLQKKSILNDNIQWTTHNTIHVANFEPAVLDTSECLALCVHIPGKLFAHQ